MTFSKKVKKELSELNNLSNKELTYLELYGYSLTFSSKEFVTESRYNINRYARLLSNVGIEDYKINVSGNNFSITTKKKIEDILTKETIVKNEEEEKAILRGAFLGSGTITEPKNAYHLEIRFKDEKSMQECQKILEKYYIKTNVILADKIEINETKKPQIKKGKSNKKYILYIEEGDSISNFLALIGAKKSMLEFEETRVLKEISNNINRQNNLENANLSKTIASSVKQINYIKLIKKRNKFNELSEKEQNLAELRLKNPDASLEELRKMLGEDISKSGINHRIKKIEELGKSLENGAK